MGKTAIFWILVAASSFATVKSQDGHGDHNLAWLYECQDIENVPRCVQVPAATSETGMPSNRCKLTCGLDGVLWPKPSTAPTIGNEVRFFHTEDVQHSLMCQGEVCVMLASAMQIFKDNLDMYYPNYNRITKSVPSKSTLAADDIYQVIITIEVTGNDTHLTLDTDESYSLTNIHVAGQVNVIIQAATFFGARHALETLSQVVNFDHEMNCLQIVDNVVISYDAPEYPYRGVLLDTSRNYFSIASLERTIDGMAANKLNTLHWHITDTASFPLVVEVYPNVTHYGAYSDEQIYTRKDIQNLVEYARVRGVRVLPEIDAPAHIGNGFQWTSGEGMGEVTVCTNKKPWTSYCVEPPCGQINIANPQIYTVLDEIYKEVVASFGPVDLFHYGGDEVNYNCWNTTEEIVTWMTENGYGLSTAAYTEQWSVFQTEASKLFNAANGASVPGIIWTSTLTEANDAGQYLSPDDYIIQIWTTGTDAQIQEILSLGFKVIFSNYDELYLDCGFGGWVNEGNSWCDPYKNWRIVYHNDPVAMAGDFVSQALGSEVALWSETCDEQSLDTKLWPRGAAIAERLWSNPAEEWKVADYRFVHNRQRLVQRGISADRTQPEWCHFNEYDCLI